MAKRNRGPEGCGSFFVRKIGRELRMEKGMRKISSRKRMGTCGEQGRRRAREEAYPAKGGQVRRQARGRNGRRREKKACFMMQERALQKGSTRMPCEKGMGEEKGNIEMSKGTRGSNGLWESQKQKTKKSSAEETFHGALCVLGWESSGVRKRAQEEQRRIQPAGREVHPALECEFAVDLGEEQLLFVGEQKGAAAGREHVPEVLQEGRV